VEKKLYLKLLMIELLMNKNPLFFILKTCFVLLNSRFLIFNIQFPLLQFKLQRKLRITIGVLEATFEKMRLSLNLKLSCKTLFQLLWKALHFYLGLINGTWFGPRLDQKTGHLLCTMVFIDWICVFLLKQTRQKLIFWSLCLLVI